MREHGKLCGVQSCLSGSWNFAQGWPYLVWSSAALCRPIALLVWGMQVLNLIIADPGKLPLVGSTSVEKQKWRKSVQVRLCAQLMTLVSIDMT